MSASRPHRHVATLRPRYGARLLVAILILLPALITPVARAVSSPWSSATRPWSTDWAVSDIVAFGSHDLAAAGAGGHIGVSHDGGSTWTVTVPTGHSATAFTAVAFNDAGTGAVASGGLLLVTHDGGANWSPASFVGPGPGTAVNDVAMCGDHAVAVGDGGVICASDDSGVTWRRLTSPTTADLDVAAVAGNGAVVIGAASGEVLAGSGSSYASVGSAGAAVTAAAAAPDPTWNDGHPDLLVNTEAGVLASDDGLSFAFLTGFPVSYSLPMPKLAWVGKPGRAILVSGSGAAGFYGTITTSWLQTQTGLSSSAEATAPGTQSVAYVLGAGGNIARTLSAGRKPATTDLSARNVWTGVRVRYTAVIDIAAPGRVLIDKRVPGRDWVTAKAIAWSNEDWRRTITLDLRPRLTTEVRVLFAYGGAPMKLAPSERVEAKPRLTPERRRYDLNIGDVYRFSGSVSPTLNGEKVALFTDRGGSWRPVAGQNSVVLRDGRQWTSRRFGAPKAETYHLRAHISRTAKHAAAWSRAVTVVIH